MKFLTVIGARPQFIKAATVSRVFQSTPNVTEILVHTGQHYDENMSEIFFTELEIPKPDYNLNIGSGNHGAQTGRMLEAIEKVLLSEKPDWVLVYGDTNSTLAGAIAAVKLHIRVAHIEAGLRSFNRKMPEEINRVLTDRASTLLFPPTEVAVKHLKQEGIAEEKIHLVGDVMYDAALFYSQKAENNSQIINCLKVNPNNYILATIHRAENTDNPKRLQAIFEALILINQEIKVILPLHPRTKNALARQGVLEKISRNIQLIEPVGYLDMAILEKNARLIITDSGGVQKEAFFYSTPCITLREETEWVELVETGWNTLVSPNYDESEIYQYFQQCLTTNKPKTVNLYGEGNSAEKIVNILQQV
jgi:UDP-GlcNAc3NAcA epimerase